MEERRLTRTNINRHLRLQILIRDNYKCRICGRSKDEVPLHVDHIIPVANGGTDEMNNLAALCRDCNLGKSDYSFKNYTEVNIIPDNIESYFKFLHDDKMGMFEQYHLYCFFKQPGGSLSSRGEFHHTWKILDTEFAVSSNPAAFENRRKAEETIIFKEMIRKALAQKHQRLVTTEEGLELR